MHYKVSKLMLNLRNPNWLDTKKGYAAMYIPLNCRAMNSSRDDNLRNLKVIVNDQIDEIFRVISIVYTIEQKNGLIATWASS